MPTHEIVQNKEFLPVNIHISKSNSHIVPSHWHTHMEIILVLEGTMHIICGENAFTLHSGDIFIINCGYIHYTRTKNATTYLLLQIPFFVLSNSIPKFSTLHFQEYLSSDILGTQFDFLDAVSHLHAMKQLYTQASDGYQLLFISHLNLFLYNLYIHYSTCLEINDTSNENKQQERLRNIITYVETHYNEQLSLSDISQHFALNPEYFCRYFKRNIGFTFLEYLNTIRLFHIHQDLLQTFDTITELQERHGFLNYKIFNRMFKEAYGCTPSKLRSQKIR